MKLRIDELRKARGLTLERLAEMAGVSKSYLSEMSSGKKPINSLRLAAVAKALNCSPLDLIDDTSVAPDLLEHLRIMRNLSDEDQASVINHAAGLARKDEQAG